MAWLLAGWPGIWFNPRFPKKIEEVKAAVPSGVIIAWPSTAGTIPSGWNRVTALDSTYTRGVPNSSTDPGATSGTTTHQHTTSNHDHTISHTHATATSGGPTGTASYTVTSSLDMDTTGHTHTTGVLSETTSNSGTASPSTSGTTSNDPAYLSVIWIQSDGTPIGIPDGALTMFNSTTLPGNWAIYTNSQDSFLKGAVTSGDGGGTGGSNTHNHTGEGSHTHTSIHSHPDGTSNNSANRSNSHASGTGGAGDVHNHTYTVSSSNFGISDAATLNTSTDDAEPPWQKLAIIQNQTGVIDFPNGIIAVWRGTLASIPYGWELADGNNGTPNLLGDFVKGVANTGEIGNIGGNTTHTHTGVNHTHTWTSTAHTHTVNLTGAPSVLRGTGSSGTARANATHTHSATSGNASAITPGNAAPNLASANNIPPYEEVAYIQYKPTTFTQNDFRFYEDEATVTLTNFWGNIITGDNEDIAVIPVAGNAPASGEQIRLQMNITVGQRNLPATYQDFKLQYKAGTDQDCSTGSWTDIGAKGATTVAWRLYNNASLADTVTEVNQISTSDVAGGYSELVTSGTNPNAVNIGQDLEWDWPIESYSGQVATATTYSFRMVKSDGLKIDYSVAGDCPTIETEPGAENLMRHGQVFVDGSEKGFFWAN